MRLLLVAALASAALAACSAADPSVASNDDDGGDSPARTSPSESDATAPLPPDSPDAPDAPDAAARDGAAPADASIGNGCPALVYPSGVKIQTFKDAATTASYAKHLAPGETAPKCFLDANNLLDPDTNTAHPLTVDVSANFQLGELVGTEISQGYGHFVLIEPAAVEALQKLRVAVGVPVGVISGFRSPKHQETVCNGLCGNPLGCPGTCANNSRHMFGDAFDLPLALYTAQDETRACSAGFKFAYLESGTHLHVDQNPAYATCVKE